MINQLDFLNHLQQKGVEFIAGVPDTLLNDFCLTVENKWSAEKHVIAANEGNAIGLAVGYHLSTGTIPLVYMQNSGLGNCVNPLLSLTHKSVYSIPLILLIGWRGNPQRKDHPQHKKQGELTTILLDDMNIPYRIVENNGKKAIDDATWAINRVIDTNQPVALIAKKGVFEKGEKDGYPRDERFELTREDAIRTIVESFPKDTLYVASTGRASRELHATREILGDSHNHDFLNVGAMGHTSSIALGLAIANSDRLVVCLEGDASVIMHMGALALIGTVKPSNFIHFILNNGAHESVGGQLSAGQLINLTEIGNFSGYKTNGKTIISKADLVKLIGDLEMQNEPYLIDIHLQKGIRKDLPPLRIDHIQEKNELMKGLLFPED